MTAVASEKIDTEVATTILFMLDPIFFISVKSAYSYLRSAFPGRGSLRIKNPVYHYRQLAIYFRDPLALRHYITVVLPFLYIKYLPPYKTMVNIFFYKKVNFFTKM